MIIELVTTRRNGESGTISLYRANYGKNTKVFLIPMYKHCETRIKVKYKDIKCYEISKELWLYIYNN